MRYVISVAAQAAALLPLSGLDQETPDNQPVFGTTVVSTSALRGKVYLIDAKTERLPPFETMQSIGSVYATSLNVWPQSFREGFPGVTDRVEWFAIDYTGKFWIEEPGLHRFSMIADDGARLWIDNQLVVDLDGTHGAISASGSALLSRGAHRIRVSYYQGPAHHVALVLAVAPPKGPWKIFHTDDFLPPKDPAEWVEGGIKDVQRLRNPYVSVPEERRRRR
jgi:hypothetical protein